MSSAGLTFKAHAFGNDPSAACTEDDVVKMIVEMLLGLSNDLFQHHEKPLHELYKGTANGHSSRVTVEVYKMTVYGRSLKLPGLSQSLLNRVLNWFAEFGSHTFICRKFAYDGNKYRKTGGMDTLTSAVIETVQSTMSDLLTSVDEALCNLESLILRLPKRTEAETLLMELQPKITILSLYQQCYRWDSMFRSLAGLVCSTIPSVVTTIAVHPGRSDQASTEPEQDDCTATVSELYQSLAMRGVLQDLSSLLQQGGLIEMPTTGQSTATVVTQANTTVGGPSGCEEFKSGTVTSGPGYADKALVLTLPAPCTSQLHQYTKLLYAAMCEKYLTNLTTAVWQGANGSSSGQNSSGQGSREAISSGVGSDSLLALSRLKAIHDVHSKAPSSAHYRRQHRRNGVFLAQLERLLRQNATSCVVPAFLATITAEALVSSIDVSILQKSHLQRQNNCYSRSRLHNLVRASVQSLQHTLLPATAPLQSNNGDGGSSQMSTAPALYGAVPTLAGLDPVTSYLTTGQSVKVVAVRSSPTSVSEPPIPSSIASDRKTGVHKVALATGGAQTRSQVLDAYFAGGVTSNRHYLHQHLFPTELDVTEAAAQSTPAQVEGGAVGTGTRGQGRERAVATLHQLLQYSHQSAKTRLTLTTALGAQLQLARADCAVYVMRQFQLLCHLRAIRDVYLLGQPDLFAAVREYCLTLTTSGSSSSSVTDHSAHHSRQEEVDTLCDAIGTAVRDAMPETGLRHVGVHAASHHSASRRSTGSVADTTSLDVTALTAGLREAVQSLSFTGASLTASGAQPSTEASEITLLRFVSTVCVSPTYQWPLTQFFTAPQLEQLNRHMRFLLLLTTSRWTAEYYWMEVISNDALSIDAYSNLRTAAPPPYKRTVKPDGTTVVTPPKPIQTDMYGQDVLQAKRNCRAGLGVWLHTITALNNIFMAHIHRTRWPDFETDLSAQAQSLLLMQHAFGELLRDVGDSLMLLREMALEVAVRGFAATWAMRHAADTEREDRRLHDETCREGGRTTAGMDHGGRAVAGQTRGRNLRSGDSGGSSNGTVAYTPSAKVLVAYRQTEDAFAALTQLVSDLRHVVALTIRQRAEKGLSERQDKALAELQFALSH